MTADGRIELLHSNFVLHGDPGRVVAPRSTPGHSHFLEGEPLTTTVLERVLAMDEHQVRDTLDDVLRRFASRHVDLEAVLEDHFKVFVERRTRGLGISRERELLLGSCFTREYAVESVALFNPSIVPHFDQGGLPAGSARFIMSVRAVGEGFFSSIGFRTGVINANGHAHVDPPMHTTIMGEEQRRRLRKAMVVAALDDVGGATEMESTVLGMLPEYFTAEDLDRALFELESERPAHTGFSAAQGRLRWIARCNYTTEFPPSSHLSERTLWPQAPTELHGMEDARFVHFRDDDGTETYFGTYTAYDGFRVVPQMIATRDFRTFEISQMNGPGAGNKGMAIFPRRIRGRRVSLSRVDRENNSVTFEGAPGVWEAPTVIQGPAQPWEVLQLGNCGSPIETDQGWLVITHGVGPMRSYAIGALLLDLDDPTRVIGKLATPLLEPSEEECLGYAPHIVYSCGSMVHDGTLVLPYGCSDATIRIATASLADVVDQLVRPS